MLQILRGIVSLPRKILVRRGTHTFFEDEEKLDGFKKLTGFRWGGRACAHVCAGEFFLPDADGLCRACRKGGRCERRTVVVADLTHAAFAKSDPAVRQRPDDIAARRQLEEMIDRLPAGLGSRLREFAAERWDALTSKEIEELRSITQDVPAEWRTKRAYTAAWHWDGSDEPEPATSISTIPDEQVVLGQRLLTLTVTQRHLAPTVANRLAHWLKKMKARHP